MGSKKPLMRLTQGGTEKNRLGPTLKELSTQSESHFLGIQNTSSPETSHVQTGHDKGQMEGGPCVLGEKRLGSSLEGLWLEQALNQSRD